MKTDVYRDGKIHVRTTMCDTCIFRPGNLMQLTSGRRDQMVSDCVEQQGTIPCHENLSHGGRPKGEAVCAGFYREHKDDIDLLQLAERLDMIERQDDAVG